MQKVDELAPLWRRASWKQGGVIVMKMYFLLDRKFAGSLVHTASVRTELL